MRCVRCGRSLIKAAKTIPSKNGPLAWGRACAIKSGLLEPKPRAKVIVVHQQAEDVDPNQMTLELAA